MIRKIGFIYCLLLLSISIISQVNLPSNSIDKARVNNWIIANDLEYKSEDLNLITKNINKYFESLDTSDFKILNLSKHKNITFSLKQLFGEINFRTTFVTACNIESSSDHLRGLSLANYEFNATIYINGEKVISNEESDYMYFDYNFKKGKNTVVIIANSFGAYNPFFNLNIIDKKYAQLKINVKKENGKPYSNGYFGLKSNKKVETFQLDKDGFVKMWIKPGTYQIGSSFEDAYVWTKKITLSENQIKNIDLILNQKSKISGKVVTMDGSSPQPGVQVNLVNSDNNKTFWSTSTNMLGEYNFKPPIGNWQINIATRNEIKYHYTEKLKTNIKVFEKSGDIKNLDFKIAKQTKGSWDHISIFDGMLSNTIRQSIISQNDNIYFGTFNGLSVYDGLNIKNYNYFNGLPNDIIRGIFEDSKGNLWIAYAKTGLIKWKDGVVINHFTKKEGLASNTIFCVSEDLKGNILVGTMEGLSIHNGTEFKNYNFSNGMGNGGVLSLKVIGNNIWIGTGGGICIFNGENFKTLDQRNFTGLTSNDSYINIIEADPLGNIWLGTNGGLLKFDGIKFKEYSTMNGLPSNIINDILFDNNGLWLATDKGFVNMKNETFKTIISNDDNGLKNIKSTSISKSKDGVYFITSEVDGVYVYDPNSFISISESEGLKSNENINDIKMDSEGYLWAGGINGLYKIENGIIIEHFDVKNSGLKSNGIAKINFATDGSLWMIGYKNISKYSNGIIKDVTKEINLPSNAYIFDIEFDDEGTIWLASNRGLGMYKNDSLIIYKESDGLVRPSTNSSVAVGKNSEIIYGTYANGFSVFNGESFTNFDISNGLANNLIWDISVDSKNNYWIALDGTGIQMYDGKEFKHYTMRDGLPSDETFSTFVDDFDNVWVGTWGGGVCYFNGEMWNSLDKRDGLLQNTIKSIYGINGDKLWFGGKNGITAYVPTHQTPNVFINEIETPSSTYSSIEKLIANKEKILKGTKTKILLNSNSFNTKSEKLKFLVKITRKDSVKSITISSNEFVFQPTKSGKYEIEFQSIDRDMNYSKPIIIKLSVVGPWFSNPATAIPFWGGLLLILSFSFYTFRKYISQRRYTSKLKEEAQIKDREARERLEEKNKEILDSINYAKRIQSAILPSNRAVKAYLKESFVLYKPKDVIAGDFYWLEYHDNKTYFAAADCTGHGVPGAMISLVCNNALNRSVREYNLSDPGKILDNTKELVVEEFGKSDENVKDGMDIALCCIEGDKLKYAGAYNPLWLVRDKKLQKIGADRQPIGSFEYSKPFKSHEIKLKKGDSIYVFSDGFMDQFGGERGKKYKSLKFQDFLLSIQEENMRKQRELLNNEIEEWRGELEQIDDICIMGVRI